MRRSFKAWTRAKDVGSDDEYVLYVLYILTFIDGFFFFENVGRFEGERNRNMFDGHHECVLKLVTR